MMLLSLRMRTTLMPRKVSGCVIFMLQMKSLVFLYFFVNEVLGFRVKAPSPSPLTTFISSVYRLTNLHFLIRQLPFKVINVTWKYKIEPVFQYLNLSLPSLSTDFPPQHSRIVESIEPKKLEKVKDILNPTKDWTPELAEEMLRTCTRRKRAYKAAFIGLSAITLFIFHSLPAFDFLFLFIYCNFLIMVITLWPEQNSTVFKNCRETNNNNSNNFFTYIARETNENVIYNQNVKNLEKTFEFPGRRHYGSYAYTTWRCTMATQTIVLMFTGVQRGSWRWFVVATCKCQNTVVRRLRMCKHLIKFKTEW